MIDIIRNKLFELKDSKYADFQSNLVPNIDKKSIIGVRVPTLRKLAKELKNSPDIKTFLHTLPHDYYDENILHSLLINEIKDYEQLLYELELFVPYIDNWAVNDLIKPKVINKHRLEYLEYIKEYLKTNETYKIRFALSILMTYYLDDGFNKEYLDLPLIINSDEYYVKMMVAWFYATALAKHYDLTISYIENYLLDKWTHNKTIQKAIESYRINDKQKEYLKKYRLK